MRRLFAVALLASLVFVPSISASDQTPRMAPTLGLYVGASSLDLVSTEIMLARPGYYEANSLMANRGTRVGAKLAVAGGLTVLDQQLLKRGHRRQAKAIRIGWIAFNAAVAGWNLSR